MGGNRAPYNGDGPLGDCDLHRGDDDNVMSKQGSLIQANFEVRSELQS